MKTANSYLPCRPLTGLATLVTFMQLFFHLVPQLRIGVLVFWRHFDEVTVANIQCSRQFYAEQQYSRINEAEERGVDV